MYLNISKQKKEGLSENISTNIVFEPVIHLIAAQVPLFSFVARPYLYFNWSFEGGAGTASRAFVKIFGRFVT